MTINATNLADTATVTGTEFETPVTINDDGGTDTDTITATGLFAPVTVNGGVGDDTVNLGAGNLFNFNSGVIVKSGGGVDTVNVNEQTDANDREYDLVGAALQRHLAAPLESEYVDVLTFATLEKLALNTGTGNNLIKLQTVPAGTTVAINGGGGTDTLVGPNVAETWNITGPNAGSFAGATFSSVESLTGGTAGDTFKFTSAGSLTGKIDGGAAQTAWIIREMAGSRPP